MKLFKKIKYELLIFIAFVASRIPALGYDIFNTDVWRWKARIYDFGSGVFTLNFVQTIQKYHPGVMLMWAGALAVKVYNFYYDIVFKMPPPDNDITTVFELHFLQKLFVVCVIGVTLAFCFHVLKKLFSTRYAFLTVFLIACEPFYVALTRVVHLEGLLATFMVASFLWFYYFLQDLQKWHRLVISAFFTAFAVLTKTSALFMLPFMGLMVFLWNLTGKASFKKALLNLLSVYWKWLGVFILGFVLFWPAMWIVPGQALQTLYRGISDIGIEQGHEQYYFSQWVSDPGPTFYFVVIAFRTSMFLLPGVFGYVLIRKQVLEVQRRFLSYMALFGLLYLIQSTLPSKKLDRYILPTIMALVPLAAAFFDWGYLHVKTSVKRYGAIVGFGAMIFFLPLLFVHPDYFSYYNPLFGGLRVGIKVLEPKWLIGQISILKYFNEFKILAGLADFTSADTVDSLSEEELSQRLVVGFQEKYYTQIWPFFNRIGARAVVADLTPHARKATFIVYPVWDDDSLEESRFKLEFVKDIKLRGVSLWRVYKVVL